MSFEHINYLELIGYLASIMVLVSMLMNSLLKLRIINLVGSGIFSVYGFLIDAPPVGFLNLFIVFANIYHLYKIKGTANNYSTLEIRNDNRYLKKFLANYDGDIKKYFPHFKYNEDLNTYSFMILQNVAVAGVFLAHKEAPNRLYIGLDYVIPEYRDLKPGKFIYQEKLDFFRDEGIETLVTIPQTSKHVDYLMKMGFEKQMHEGQAQYILHIEKSN